MKLRVDGTIERYKAKLMDRGDKQVFGEDYYMTFSTVIEINNVKIILIMDQIWGVPARHGDVSSAYPKAETEGEY